MGKGLSVLEWLKAVPARAVRFTVHVGEGKTTPAVGEVLRADYQDDDDNVDAARMSADIMTTLNAAGWPATYPTARVFAYAAEGRTAVTTWTLTERPAAATEGGNPSTEQALVKALVDMTGTMRLVVQDIAQSWKAEREYSTELQRSATSRASEVAELTAANGLLEAAVEDHRKSDELEVKLRGLEVAERAIDGAMATRMSPEALKKFARDNPEKFADMKKRLMSDPELMALLMS